MDVNGNDRQRSEFNDAIGRLRRIDTWVQGVQISAFEKNILGWQSSLKNLFYELVTEMKKEEREAWLLKYKEMNNEIYRLLNNKHIKNKNIPASMIDGFDMLFITLLDIYKESGLQGRLQDEAAKALR